jgi:uncharacterized membrane protein (DUF4010 family)
VTALDPLPTLLALGVAALGGLAVGIEREWSARQGQAIQRFAGVRTFLLLGLVGGLAAILARATSGGFGMLLLAGGLALVAVAYFATAHEGRVDATTEVAALVVLGAGVLAGYDQLAVASALAALTALVLVEKSVLHAWVERLRSEEIAAGARFAVLALVVLPLLPKGPFGPGFGVRPREIWLLVLIFSGLSFAGYVALRAAGPERGLGLAGLLGGLVSSTAVTLNFSRESRRQPDVGGALALGILAASTIMPLRVAVLAAILNRELAWRAAPLLAVPFVVGIALVALAWRGREGGGTPAPPPGNPLRLVAALEMAVAFQVVLYAMEWMSDRLGNSGVLATAAVTGLADLDALTYSLSRLAGAGATVEVAARGLGVGVLANSALKLALALTFAVGRCRRLAGLGLAALGVATAAALLVL